MPAWVDLEYPARFIPFLRIEWTSTRHPKHAAWQRGSGVVSFGKKQLGWVLEYIANQKEHHARDTWVDRLERITVEEAMPEECLKAGIEKTG